MPIVSLNPTRLRLHAAYRIMLSAAAVCMMTMAVPAQAQQFPDCVSASSDVDGDGWGWENNRSCVVVNAPSSSSSVVSTPLHPACRSAASDPDGDGYGYEDGESCLVQQASTPSLSTSSQSNKQSESNILPECIDGGSDSDGDGYGWENNRSCIVTSGTTAFNSGESTAAKISAAQSGTYTIDSVTDVVLVTGQSNVLGANTSFNSELDKPNSQVFAYTDSGWQVADLHQVWDRFLHPGNRSTSNPGRNPANSFAFHFGKQLVSRDASRVVAFIVVPGPGEGISYWDAGGEQYRRIQDKVRKALNKIPHKYFLDAVLWHQGENDFLYEGTADANPTGFTSRDSYEYRNYYQIKLNTLINNFRNEPWGTLQTPFICGETRRGEGVNRRLNALNYDNDAFTACVRGSDLPKRADDAVGSHFSAEGLRTLGRRYADKYFELSSR